MANAYDLFRKVNDLLEKHYDYESRMELPKTDESLDEEEKFKRLYSFVSSANRKKLTEALNVFREVVEHIGSGKLEFKTTDVKETDEEDILEVRFIDNLNHKTAVIVPTYEYARKFFPEHEFRGNVNNSIVRYWKNKEWTGAFGYSTDDMSLGEPGFKPPEIFFYCPRSYVLKSSYSMFVDGYDLKESLNEFRRWLTDILPRNPNTTLEGEFYHQLWELPVKTEIVKILGKGVRKLNDEHKKAEDEKKKERFKKMKDSIKGKKF